MLPEWVGHVETMRYDWTQLTPVLRRHGIEVSELQHRNRTADRRQWSVYYAGPVLEIACGRYADDMAAWYS